MSYFRLIKSRARVETKKLWNADAVLLFIAAPITGGVIGYIAAQILTIEIRII
jgi:hypothetical protein